MARTFAVDLEQVGEHSGEGGDIGRLHVRPNAACGLALLDGLDHDGAPATGGDAIREASRHPRGDRPGDRDAHGEADDGVDERFDLIRAGVEAHEDRAGVIDP